MKIFNLFITFASASALNDTEIVAQPRLSDEERRELEALRFGVSNTNLRYKIIEF